jgi:hypothetical protein
MKSKTPKLAFAAVVQFRPVALRKGMLALCLTLCTLGLSFSASAQGPTFTTFDPPGATSTQAFSINPAGAITGFYVDASGDHGFLRTRDGTFTTFDPPGATFTFPRSINPAGAITGYYLGADLVNHGFLRARDGSFTTFDSPGATGTTPLSINPAGAITGYYFGADFVQHGFLRSA